MTTNSVKAPSYGLSLLLGEYNSDSESEDGGSEQLPRKSVQEISEAVDDFVSELDSVCQPVGTTSWTKCMDKNTGHPYYWNTESKEVTWEVPSDYQMYLDQNERLLADASVANMWTVCFTDETNTSVYYVNEYTRIVSWNKPIGYVEPPAAAVAVAVPEVVEPKPSKNIIKRRRTAKPKRDNPFIGGKDEDNEKIELITSFAGKSDSSSDEERHKTASPSNSMKLKLVATDYNSDDNHASNGTSSPSSHLAIIPKNVKTADAVTKTALTKPVKKSNTFASIITGGRSPEQTASTDLHLPPEHELLALNAQTEPTLETPVKMAKRKRRIEFITTATETPETEGETNVPTEPKDVVSGVESKKTNAYANFKTGAVEFGKSVADNVVETAAAVVEDVGNESTQTDMTKLKETIEAKLKFLCDGRSEVPAVQAILIQLETLIEAHDEGALQAAYMFKWLEGIDTDLQTLEADAAPTGWKCLWNRSKSQYCYKHVDTGDIQWEYPGGNLDDALDSVDDECGTTGEAHTGGRASERRDDAMDICTTPPPNVDEQLVLAAAGPSSKAKSKNVRGLSDSSKWNASNKATEPLPPGKDSMHLENGTAASSSNISMELASFYSDLAAIDSATPLAEPAATVVDPPAASTLNANESVVTVATAAADETAKKKKRKIKKLQPWRSGNLESWINKWQKAQQELDN